MQEPRLFTFEQTETTSDDYYTPKWIFDTLGLHFDLDVAAPPGGAPFVPCTRYYTQKDDGLASEWAGRVWMNPPFSNPTPWVRRWTQHGNGIALLPTSNGKWFRNLWNEQVAWVALPYNVKFIAGDGRKLGTMPLPCWVVGVGDDNIKALHNFGRVR